MRIVWDDNKRRENLAKHGLDFSDVDLEFFLSAAVTRARSHRFVAVGRHAGGRAIAVVFRSMGAEAISLI